MTLSKRLRYEILRRDNHTCRYCGASAPDVALTVDHVVPQALGGSNEPSNLVAACRDCNSGKASTTPDAPLVDQVSDDAIRWAKAMERAAEIDRTKRDDDRQFANNFVDVLVAYMKADPNEETYILPMPHHVGGREGLHRTIIQFRDAGLDLDDLDACLRTAITKRTINEDTVWRYFCGVCWRLIEDRQAKARALLVGEEVSDGA